MPKKCWVFFPINLMYYVVVDIRRSLKQAYQQHEKDKKFPAKIPGGLKINPKLFFCQKALKKFQLT